MVANAEGVGMEAREGAVRMSAYGARYEIFEQKNGRWRFRLIAGNGEQVGPASEDYRDFTDAERAVHDHKRASAAATIVKEGE